MKKTKRFTAFFLVIVMLVSIMPNNAYATDASKDIEEKRNIRGNTIASGNHHSMAISSNGTLLAWGSGYLGDGTYASNSPPQSIMENVVTVAAGSFHSLAITTDGTLWAWGLNISGQIGDGTNENRLTPTKVMDNVVYVTASQANSLAITADGSLWGWGASSLFGEGNKTQNKPVKIMDGVWTASINVNHILVVTTEGTLLSWGMEWDGRLGNGTAFSGSCVGQDSAVRVMENVVSVSASPNHSLALTSDGVLWAWGSNKGGQIGVSGIHASPVKVMENVVHIEAGDNVGLGRGHSFAITADGYLWAWGFGGEEGRLGTTSADLRRSDNWQQNTPTKVMNLYNVVSVTADESRTLALTAEGHLWAWGKVSSESGEQAIRGIPVKVMDDVMLPHADKTNYQANSVNFTDLDLKIYQAPRLPGFNEDGSRAEDLMAATKSRDEILEMVNFIPYDFVLTAKEHQDMMASMFDFYSTEPLKSVVLEMVDNFISRRDEYFENPILTEAIKNHSSTKNYVEWVKQAVDQLLKEHYGDVMKLEYNTVSRLDSPLVEKMFDEDGNSVLPLPAFNNPMGLLLAIHSVWGSEIVVKNYRLDDNGTYEITLTFTFYDHFGLDANDMEKRVTPLGGILGGAIFEDDIDIDYVAFERGFRSWYILQHYEGYMGVYRPFITVMSFDVTFTGSAN